MRYQDSQLQESNRDFAALADIKALMAQRGFPEDVIALYIEKAVRLLDKCADEFGVGTQFRYTFDNHFGRI